MENDALMEDGGQNQEDEMTLEDCWNICWLDSERCIAHKPPKRKAQNCKKNPYCIHRLGLEKFDKLLKTQQTSKVLVRREESKQPCGLNNAGNFCYVNSFLQIWFNDLKFRQCVYNWRSSTNWIMPQNAKLNIQTVMNCLQQLFLTMQFTPFEVTDANDFIKLLRLDNQQQDVQEFHTLFFGTIERTLEAHPNGRPVLDVIRQLFQSRISQTISCANCLRTSETVGEYRSLQIGIDGHNTLISAIQSFFAPEPLRDFRCDQCRESNCVTRSSRFTQLPELLIVQLNRYVLASNGNLRKLQNAVHYPRLLTAEELQLEGIPDYELCAVMIHEGKSTNSGHYYDVIRDPVIDRWFTYNDETVNQKRTAPGYLGRLTQKPRASADTTGCYALIYRRVGSGLRGTVQLPPENIVTEAKKRMEAEFAQQDKEDDLAFKKWKKHINERNHLLQQLWKELEVQEGHTSFEHPEDIAFLPTTLLTDLLTKELTAVEECKSVTATYKPSRVSDVPIQLCEHGRAMPGPFIRGEMKAVNTSAARRLIREFNVNTTLYTGANICINCCSRLRDHQETRRRGRTAAILYYPEGATLFIKLNGDENDGNTTKGKKASKGLIKIRICSDETINALKLRIYEKIDQSPVDQLLYMGGQVLDGNLTLERARVPANNFDNPLILIVQRRRKSGEDDDSDQKAGSSGGGGFHDTALS
ncbi:hypothetical protein niasHS_007548 [Heterodera schachtii]|uniref:Ubiquitin carboxyl-terminal hydrolase n=1 Tax=Heterodera schachtii TaxID=97005 RepID=A0ABD2JY00_HETSC